MKKFELTTETKINIFGKKLFRIKALISFGFILILIVTFPWWSSPKIGSTIENLVGNVKCPFLAFLKFSIVQTKLFVIVFSNIKSLLLPISKVKFFSDFSAVLIIFSSIFSLFTKSLKYAHLL